MYLVGPMFKRLYSNRIKKYISPPWYDEGYKNILQLKNNADNIHNKQIKTHYTEYCIAFSVCFLIAITFNVLGNVLRTLAINTH